MISIAQPAAGPWNTELADIPRDGTILLAEVSIGDGFYTIQSCEHGWRLMGGGANFFNDLHIRRWARISA